MKSRFNKILALVTGMAIFTGCYAAAFREATDPMYVLLDGRLKLW